MSASGRHPRTSLPSQTYRGHIPGAMNPDRRSAPISSGFSARYGRAISRHPRFRQAARFIMDMLIPMLLVNDLFERQAQPPIAVLQHFLQQLLCLQGYHRRTNQGGESIVGLHGKRCAANSP